MGLSSGGAAPLRTPVRKREPYDIRASLLCSGIARFDTSRRRSRVCLDCGSRLRDVRAPFDDMIDETLNESTTLAEAGRRLAKSIRDPIEQERRTRLRVTCTPTGQYDESLSQFKAMLKKQRSAYTGSKNFNQSTNRSSSQVNPIRLISDSFNSRASHPGSLGSYSVQNQWQSGQMMTPRSTNEFDNQNNHIGSLISRGSSYFSLAASVAGSSSTAGTSERKRKADDLDHSNEAESKPPTKSRPEDF